MLWKTRRARKDARGYHLLVVCNHGRNLKADCARVSAGQTREKTLCRREVARAGVRYGLRVFVCMYV